MSAKRKKIILIVLVLLVAAVLIRLFVWKKDFYYAGTVEVTKVDIPTRVTSVISQFLVEEGDIVKKDQDLVKLSCEDIRVNYGLALSTYERSQKLYRAGSVSQEMYDNTRAKKEDLELRNQWCDIKAPLNGRVITKYHETAEWVNQGTKLLTLANLQEVWVYFYLPAPEIAHLKVGQKVTAYLPELDMKSFDGKIQVINPEAEFTPKNVQTREERTRLVYGVKVAFANPDEILKPGMSLEWKLEK
jgi:HlyD family secretion protein